MPRLSRAQERARQRIIDLSYRALSPERLAMGILESLALAIPADRHTLFGVDPDTALLNRVLASTADAATTLGWLRRTYLVNEPTLELSFVGLMRLGTSAAVIGERMETSWGIPEDRFYPLSPSSYRRLYRDIGAPARGILRGFFSVGGYWVAALDAIRSETYGAFSPGDLYFLRFLAPLVGRSLQSAFHREGAKPETDTVTDGTAGVLVLDQHDRVAFYTPAALRLIEGLRETWQPEAPGKMQLPTAVWSALARLRAPYNEDTSAAVKVKSSHGVVHVEASPGSDPGSIAVVLTPQRPPARPVLPDDWPLTNAERRVVELLAHGLGNQGIATALHISAKTVETHLSHAYEKLGVQGRAQLLAHLFHQTTLPELDARLQPE